MARKVALINMKGGVGKSTLCINLAWYFALPRDSKRVLVVDLDPQFNASQYLLGTQRFPEEPKHLQDKDLCVHYFAMKSLSWYAPNIRP